MEFLDVPAKVRGERVCMLQASAVLPEYLQGVICVIPLAGAFSKSLSECAPWPCQPTMRIL